jgi:hypothetical protein
MTRPTHPTTPQHVQPAQRPGRAFSAPAPSPDGRWPHWAGAGGRGAAMPPAGRCSHDSRALEHSRGPRLQQLGHTKERCRPTRRVHRLSAASPQPAVLLPDRGSWPPTSWLRAPHETATGPGRWSLLTSGSAGTATGHLLLLCRWQSVQRRHHHLPHRRVQKAPTLLAVAPVTPRDRPRKAGASEATCAACLCWLYGDHYYRE